MHENLDKLSWYLNLNINDIRNVFLDNILLYELDCYFCKCGNKKIILKNVMETLEDYSCDVCENSSFKNANDYSNNFIWYEPIHNLLSEEYLLSLEPKISYNDEKKLLLANTSIKVPISYDLASDKAIYKSKILFTLSLGKDEDYQQTINVNFSRERTRIKNPIEENFIFNELKRKILKRFKEYSYKFESPLLLKTSSIEEFVFFIHNSHLIDLDFYKWENYQILPKNKPLSILDGLNFIINQRSEKSIKKAVYKNYQYQIRNFEKYDFFYIYTISRFIEDSNILKRMIDIDIKEAMKYLVDYDALFLYVKYLKEKFSDKQIEKLFLSYEEKDLFWLVDTVAMFYEMIDNLDDLIIEKCKYDHIHNDITYYHKVIIEKELFITNFIYENRFLNSCLKNDDYEVKLPKNGKELYEWSNILKNCLSGYGRVIKEKRAVVFGFFKENKLEFAVEIRNNKIYQSKSKYNQDLKKEDANLVLGWFQEFSNNHK